MPKRSSIIIEQSQVGSDPTTPGSGYSVIYPKTDNKWYTKDPSGNVVDLSPETTTTTGALINGATGKTTPVDADFVGLMDSAAGNVLKKLSWANVKATLKSYFDSLTTTYTNKRITPRIGTTASSSTPTPTADTADQYTITALAANATFAAPSGTPTDGQPILIRIKDNGTARTLAWNAIYRGGTILALPTTTTISKTMYVQFVYNSADTKWDLVGVTDGI